MAADHPPVLLHVPPGTPRARRPVIVMLPGAGQPGTYAEQYTSYSALADRHGFLVAYPTASGARLFWNVSAGGRVAGDQRRREPFGRAPPPPARTPPEGWAC